MLIQRLKYIELALPSQGTARFPDVQELKGKYIHSITYVPFTTGVKPYYPSIPDFDAPVSTPYLLSLREAGTSTFFMKNVNAALFYNRGNLAEAVHINKILDLPNCEVFNPTNKTVGLGLTIAYGDAPVDSTASNDYIPMRAFSHEIELIASYGTREYLGNNKIGRAHV